MLLLLLLPTRHEGGISFPATFQSRLPAMPQHSSMLWTKSHAALALVPTVVFSTYLAIAVVIVPLISLSELAGFAARMKMMPPTWC